jgi:hypothetical protein
MPLRIRSGSGTLFMKLESPASAKLAPTCPAVAPAAIATAPVRKSLRWTLDIGFSLIMRSRGIDVKKTFDYILIVEPCYSIPGLGPVNVPETNSGERRHSDPWNILASATT